MQTDTHAAPKIGRRTPLLLAVAATIGALALFAALPVDALLGFDAFPLIAAAREGGITGALTDELMAGRYPDGRFYRPLIHLSFLVDDALGGRSLSPVPFRITDIAIAAIAATLLGTIVAELGRQRTEGDPARVSKVPLVFGGFAAVLGYIAHQGQLEVVPYAPRRADAMAVLFVAATVLAALRGARPVWLGLFTLFALLSKETGVIAVPLAFVAVMVRLDRPGAGAAARACILPVGAIALGIAARFVVLGELGGHAESGAQAARAGLLSTGQAAWKLFGAGVPGGSGGITVLLLAITAIGAATFRPGVMALTGTWLLLGLGLTALSGRMHAWYVIVFLPPVALLCGTAVCAALATHRKAAWLGGGAGASVVALFVIGSFTSPQRSTLRIATQIAEDQVDRFTAVAESVPERGFAPFEPWVFAAATEPGTPPVFLHTTYSLQALADLLRPELDLVVAPAGTPARGDATTVITLFPGGPPASALRR